MKAAASERAAFRDIAIIALRRKYIPPVMEGYQDLLLVFYGAKAEYESAEGAFLGQAERIADTLSPRSRGFMSDDIVIQAKADALLLDEEAYDWLSRKRRSFASTGARCVGAA